MTLAAGSVIAMCCSWGIRALPASASCQHREHSVSLFIWIVRKSADSEMLKSAAQKEDSV